MTADGPSGRVGNAPCSWGTLEGARGERVPYTQMLDELVETGYTGTELGDWGFMPTDTEQLRDELESRELTMLGAFETVFLADRKEHAGGWERLRRTARQLSAVADIGDPSWLPYLVLSDDHSRDRARFENAGRVVSRLSLDPGDFWNFAKGAEELARAVLEETGIRTVFHPHCAGFVETLEETERLLDITDSALINIVFDTGHMLYGSGSSDGQTVLDALDRFGERVTYVHFKDCHPGVADRARHEGWDYLRAVREGVFCELGRGAVDFSAVLSKLGELNYRGWITVEQDVLPGMGTPRESAERNREYLRSIGL